MNGYGNATDAHTYSIYATHMTHEQRHLSARQKERKTKKKIKRRITAAGETWRIAAARCKCENSDRFASNEVNDWRLTSSASSLPLNNSILLSCMYDSDGLSISFFIRLHAVHDPNVNCQREFVHEHNANTLH